MKKHLLALFAFAVIICCPLSVKASEEITAKNFDYNWYLEQHPDLAAVSTDPATVYQFYLNTGLPADWNGRIAPAYITNETVLKCYAIVDSITNPSMTQRQKVTAIHKWICQNVEYDYSFSHYSLEGAVNEGLAVCQGYAVTFNEMCNAAGIECEMVTGTTDSSIVRTVSVDGQTLYIYAAGNGGHAWNQVKVDGQWYQIDTTWDDGYGEYTSDGFITTYFLITPENMMYDHKYNNPSEIHY